MGDWENKAPTPTEQRLLQEMADGFEMKETADRLHISVKTVKSHRSNLYRRIDAMNAPHAVAIGFRKGWII
jgi:DNA-binding CsgD family transcriptional regulator